MSDSDSVDDDQTMPRSAMYCSGDVNDASRLCLHQEPSPSPGINVANSVILTVADITIANWMG